MPPTRPLRGRIIQVDFPRWGALFDLASQHLEEFMWMFEVELEDGIRPDAYKHCGIGNHLHLDDHGRAFVHREDDRFEEVDPGWLLDAVARPKRFGRLSDYNVRRNYQPFNLEWARSATRHRISRERSRYVIQCCSFYFEEAVVSDGTPPRFVFVGDDPDGIAIEVVAVEVAPRQILVIHAMPLRARYRAQYEEVRIWET
jgi:hypothetical protein